MLNAAETCFDKANEVRDETEGTHAERHEAFLDAYDACEKEKEEQCLVE